MWFRILLRAHLGINIPDIKYKDEIWWFNSKEHSQMICIISPEARAYCTLFTHLIHLVLASLSHTSPYCAASRRAIDLALLRYHLLFLTFLSQRACRIYFLLTSCLFSLSHVPLQWGSGVLYCLPHSAVLSICFRQVITLALLSSCSFISFTIQPSPTHLSWPYIYIFIYFLRPFPALIALCVVSPFPSSPVFTSRSSSEAVGEPYFVLRKPSQPGSICMIMQRHCWLVPGKSF